MDPLKYVGMKPLSERDENLALGEPLTVYCIKSRNEATL